MSRRRSNRFCCLKFSSGIDGVTVYIWTANGGSQEQENEQIRKDISDAASVEVARIYGLRDALLFEAAPLDAQNSIYAADHPTAKDLYFGALEAINLLNGLMTDEVDYKSVAVNELMMRDLTAKSADLRKSLHSQQGI